MSISRDLMNNPILIAALKRLQMQNTPALDRSPPPQSQGNIASDDEVGYIAEHGNDAYNQGQTIPIANPDEQTSFGAPEPQQLQQGGAQAPQMGAAQADQQGGGSGFMDFLQKNRGFIGGLGAGISKFAQQPTDIMGTALEVAPKIQKQISAQDVQEFMKEHPDANIEQLGRAMIQSGDPDMINKGATLIQALRKSGQVTPTVQMKNAAALGLKPGTKEYEDYVRKASLGTVGRYGSQVQKLQQSYRDEVQALTGFDGEKLREAENAYRQGKTILDDGTKLPPPTENMRDLESGIATSTSTAPLITSGVQANQAEAELSVLEHHAGKAMEKYGDTYAGYSPAQIFDSLKTTAASQEDLGKLVASQALQYEIAQIRNRIAGGEKGIQATNELMDKSGQHIKMLFPRMSKEARKAASDYISKALKEGLDARNRYGVRASGATGKKRNLSEAELDKVGTAPSKWEIVDGELVEKKQ